MTNQTGTQITGDEIRQLYGLCWRIETLFRSWKRDKHWACVLRHISNPHPYCVGEPWNSESILVGIG